MKAVGECCAVLTLIRNTMTKVARLHAYDAEKLGCIKRGFAIRAGIIGDPRHARVQWKTSHIFMTQNLNHLLG